MTWNDVGHFVGKAAPILGGVLGGPGGAAAGRILGAALGVESTPDKVLDALKSDPAAIVRVKELESNERIRIEEIRRTAETAGIQEETKQLQSVNETMRAEAASSNNFSAFWRPFWGVVSGTAFLIVCVFVCVLGYRAIFTGDADAMRMIPDFISSMATLFLIPGGILGAASWHRGMQHRIEAGEQPAQSRLPWGGKGR